MYIKKYTNNINIIIENDCPALFINKEYIPFSINLSGISPFYYSYSFTWLKISKNDGIKGI